jgi:predicted MFS family arabinose efflux permease
MGPPLIGYIAEAFSLRYSYGVFACFGLLMFVMVGRLSLLKKHAQPNLSKHIFTEFAF